MFNLQLTFARFVRKKFGIEIKEAYACEALQIYVELGEALSETDTDRRLEEFIDTMCFLINMNESTYAPVVFEEIAKKCEKVLSIPLPNGLTTEKAVIQFIEKGSAYFNYNHFSKYWKSKKEAREPRVTSALWIDYFMALVFLIKTYGYTENEIREKFKYKLAINYKRQNNGY